MVKNRKTTSRAKSNPMKDLAESPAPEPTPARPTLRLKNRGGAPKGNRNAWKTGRYCRELKDLRVKVRATQIRIRVLVAQANVQIASR